MNSVPKLFSCYYADCWTENHFSTEFGVLTPNHTHSHTFFWGAFQGGSGERLHGMQEVTGSIPVISIPRHFTRNREVLFILSASKCITILQILCKIKVEVRRNVQDAALIIGTFAGKYMEPIKHNMHKITGICQKCLQREVGLL